MTNQNSVWAADAYLSAKQLPSTTTEAHLAEDDLILNGPLLGEGHKLIICFKKTVPNLLKPVEEREKNRLTENKEQLQHPNIIPFEFVGSNYIIMPLHPTTLEHLARLLPGCELTLWQSIEPALTFLHNHSLAHMDVKPSNILITCDGFFILGDLGSIAKFGQRTVSTEPYIPRDMQKGSSYFADPMMDWWMLAMTFAEKVIELRIGSSSSAPKQHTLRQRLAQDQRMRNVWEFLASKLHQS
jgi:serine/threonine protein kinase